MLDSLMKWKGIATLLRDVMKTKEGEKRTQQQSREVIRQLGMP